MENRFGIGLQDVQLYTTRGKEILIYQDRLYRKESYSKPPYVNPKGDKKTIYWICCHTANCAGRGQQTVSLDELTGLEIGNPVFTTKVNN